MIDLLKNESIEYKMLRLQDKFLNAKTPRRQDEITQYSSDNSWRLGVLASWRLKIMTKLTEFKNLLC